MGESEIDEHLCGQRGDGLFGREGRRRRLLLVVVSPLLQRGDGGVCDQLEVEDEAHLTTTTTITSVDKQ